MATVYVGWLDSAWFYSQTALSRLTHSCRTTVWSLTAGRYGLRLS